ncbi:MAG: hypothetical protein K6F84_03235 [Lachnospiraceae bacterium]|nr:hypothetical protein [Lachnospiraceae bacterium]
MIRKFKEVHGRYIEKIIGQDRLAYTMSDTADLYDLVEYARRGGYQGSVIIFYDFENGNVYKPFEQKRDVIYSRPAYVDGYYYFLQADYEFKKVTLYKYFPKSVLEAVTEFGTDEVSLYNLSIVGEKVHVISQGDQNGFRCYYPERISFPMEGPETVVFITDDRVYIEAWVEEGWDDENDCATDDYKFYNKVIIKDFEGNTISEELGSIYQAADKTYWIS